MSSIKTFYVGIKGVLVNRSKRQALVLLREKDDGERYWDIPGGRMDDDERIHDTLLRELKEEIPNLPSEIEVDRLLNAYRLSHDLPDGHGLMLLFHRVFTEFENVVISDEHIAYRWVSLSEVDKLDGQEGAYIDKGNAEAIKLALSDLS